MQVSKTEMLIPYVTGFRTSHAPMPYLSISHEGIFLSNFVFVFIGWDEMSALVPYSYNSEGNPRFLGIVLRDNRAVLTRFLEQNSRNIWQRALYSFLAQTSAWLSHLLGIPSPLYISQGVLPISIDELITAVQERFAIELREYHITILKQQS